MQVAISRLTVLQNGLRNLDQVERMVEFVGQGGRFTFDARLAQHTLVPPEDSRPTPPPMHISIMEDGKLFLHDGHHRAVSMLLAGRQYIDESEYEFGKYTYADYAEPNPKNDWFTPFDPMLEVRKPDFLEFKKKAKDIYKNKGGFPLLIEFIDSNTSLYLERRRITTVEELVNVYVNSNPKTKTVGEKWATKTETYVNCAAKS